VVSTIANCSYVCVTDFHECDSDTFFFDLASTLPSLVTLYSIPNLYYFKVLRLV